MSLHSFFLKNIDPHLTDTVDNKCLETLCLFFEHTEIEIFFQTVLLVCKKITSIVD